MQKTNDDGVNALIHEDNIYTRNAWANRWISWICGWGAVFLAAFSGVAGKLYPQNPSVQTWAGLIAAGLAAITQVVKPELWADAYYRGHLHLNTALVTFLLGKTDKDGLNRAWERAQSGLPGAAAPKTQPPKSGVKS